MIMTFLHTMCYLFWLVILAAIAVITVSIACVVVKVIFLDSKKSQTEVDDR